MYTRKLISDSSFSIEARQQAKTPIQKIWTKGFILKVNPIQKIWTRGFILKPRVRAVSAHRKSNNIIMYTRKPANAGKGSCGERGGCGCGKKK
jgi:hypothetical protein